MLPAPIATLKRRRIFPHITAFRKVQRIASVFGWVETGRLVGRSATDPQTNEQEDRVAWGRRDCLKTGNSTAMPSSGSGLQPGHVAYSTDARNTGT